MFTPVAVILLALVVHQLVLQQRLQAAVRASMPACVSHAKDVSMCVGKVFAVQVKAEWTAEFGVVIHL
jgi:hypothetical protein